MSSSASPARASPEPVPGAVIEQPIVAPFAYTEVEPEGTGDGNALPAGHAAAAKPAPDPAAAAKSAAVRDAQMRELGRQQGEAEQRAKSEEQLVREHAAVAKAVTDFARDRAVYYRRLEEEAVRLALSIARRILHREAQVDPLLLMGVVKVALEKIEGATEVALLVHPQRAADWRRQLAAMMVAGKPLEIVEDPSLEPDQCRLRTSMGTADLGLEGQLKEIEAGLTDLLAARPKD
jgi:flagellar biosynthesis/type III secretory pathway protein FliH